MDQEKNNETLFSKEELTLIKSLINLVLNADHLEKAYLSGWNESMNYVCEKLNKACDSYETLIKTERDEQTKTIYKGRLFELYNWLGYFGGKKLT